MCAIICVLKTSIMLVWAIIRTKALYSFQALVMQIYDKAFFIALIVLVCAMICAEALYVVVKR